MPVAHQQQVLAAVGLVHDVAGHQQRGAAAGKSVELLPQIDPQHGVQADGRFVEDEQIGLTTSAQANETRVALAAGQIAAQGGSVISEANRVNGGIGGSGVHPYSAAK